MPKNIEQADGQGGTNNHRKLKKLKKQIERHKAKQNPETQPRYGKYKGYES